MFRLPVRDGVPEASPRVPWRRVVCALGRAPWSLKPGVCTCVRTASHLDVHAVAAASLALEGRHTRWCGHGCAHGRRLRRARPGAPRQPRSRGAARARGGKATRRRCHRAPRAAGCARAAGFGMRRALGARGRSGARECGSFRGIREAQRPGKACPANKTHFTRARPVHRSVAGWAVSRQPLGCECARLTASPCAPLRLRAQLEVIEEQHPLTGE